MEQKKPVRPIGTSHQFRPNRRPSISQSREVSTKGLHRREFLISTASFAFSTATLAMFLNACSSSQSNSNTFVPTSPQSPSTTPAPNSTQVTTTLPLSETPPPQITTPPSIQTKEPTQTPVIILTDRQKISHLLRRAGFGATAQDLDKFVTMGVSATIDYLVDFENTDNTALETRLSKINLDLDTLVDLQRWWYLRMIYTERPLQEKIVLFWHGLLTSGYSKVGRGPYMHNQNELFRRLGMDEFGPLLKAIARDPAMLIWLDSQVNVKSAPNENFARELMELFSMGIGNYTEQDVRESARSFTGWLLVNKAFSFNSSQHDTGSKTFLGETGNWNGDDVIDIILKQPVTAQFICRKLFEFFAYPNPSDASLSGLTKVFRDSGNNIKEVVRQILRSPEFFSLNAYRANLKTPSDLVAGTVRILGVETDAAGLTSYGTRMGQSLFDPFDVSGWLQGGATWINSNSLLQRLNYANTIATARTSSFKFDPVEMARRLNINTPDRLIAYFSDVLLDGNLSVESRSILNAFARSLDFPGGFNNLPASTIDEKIRSLVYLMIAMPEYQLA